MMKTAFRLLPLLCLAAGLALVLPHVRSARAGRERQRQEEDLARAFCEAALGRGPEDVRGDAAGGTGGSPSAGTGETGSVSAEEGPGSAEEPEETGPADPWAADPNWYVRDGTVLTPDYAKGSILCVLSYPKAGIFRPVFTGTWEEIEADLDLWMVTAARPDYEAGRTHLVILGHNHTEQDLSFNNLQPAAAAGDEFSLVFPGEERVYRVTAVYALSREEAATQVTDNFDLPAERCYLLTCGRGPFRYRDLCVEAELDRTVKAGK